MAAADRPSDPSRGGAAARPGRAEDGPGRTASGSEAAPAPAGPGAAAELAARLLEARLEESGAPDPRGLRRENLRNLRERDPEACGKALDYYRDELLPKIAGGADPLCAWAEYGRLVTALLAPGDAVRVRADGSAEPVDGEMEGELALDELLLHLPRKGRALVIAEPGEPSAAQTATRALLVEGRQRL